ncbi:DNA polymerase [Proteiniclasticum sp. QWL-01]|nr:DNA polymerase [Proteiniclasticum sp. QWL-01]WFF73658.1 DNA polymerase [Proteiniclasticum sp. QWL-01]
MEIKTLSLDLETFSDVDLKKSGVYRYAQSPAFEILLFGYAINGGPSVVLDLAMGETIPEELLDALTDPGVIKWGFNSNFERVCLSAWIRKHHPDKFKGYGNLDDTVGEYLDPSSWRCSMVWSAYLGLPLSLAGVGTVLKLKDQKLKEGQDLIRYFCMPCKPTQTNGGRTRNLPQHDMARWELFKKYNQRDVETELAIQKRLESYPVPDFIWDEYHLDQEINDRGILLDMDLVENAISLDEMTREKLTKAMQDLTSLENPNSTAQVRQWLSDQGTDTGSLGKKNVTALIDSVPARQREVLQLRQQLSKSSVRKYHAMRNTVCADGRARGMFFFYGASRSGRWAGRHIQLQNLPQNHLPDLEDARSLVKLGDYKALELLYDDVPDTLSQLIRTAFIPRPGYKFIVSDFSAIEARVLSYLAGEEWRLEVFENDGDIYCASASAMFNVPVEKHGVNSHLRQKGKQAELACIAEGQPVLTDQGLIPIEEVMLHHRLWDGENWVSHEGVIFKGEREVITYDGLTATPDHLVWVEGQQEPIQFGIAASSGSHLLQVGYGRKAIRLGEDHLIRKKKRTARLYDIRNAGPNHRFTVSGKLVHNCGYGGSVGALKAMGALEMGLKEAELKPLVDSWRAANPNITKFWWDVDRAAKEAVRLRCETQTHGITFTYKKGMLFIGLPSGRSLSYVKPKIEINQYGNESVTYEGTGIAKKWERIESYGPKFVENIVQAISRDILAFALKSQRHLFICGHVHDEIIFECPMDVSLMDVCREMGRSPWWISDITLRADSFETTFYKKD